MPISRTDFLDFKTLVGKPITLENERRSLEDIRKRKRDQTNHPRNNTKIISFQRNGANKPTTNDTRPNKNFHARDKDFTNRPGVTCYAVEKRDTMLNSAQSQETQHRSQTATE